MEMLDVRKKKVFPSDPRHSKHAEFLARRARRAKLRYVRNRRWSFSLAIVGVLFSIITLNVQHRANASGAYQDQALAQGERAKAFEHFAALPVEHTDPKVTEVEAYLAEKKSPLVAYAGEISRMENWKLILGIAHAESNLCKRTDRNNCWGIGPGGPWYYDDIEDSLYYANALLEKYQSLGMSRPETMVRTYVGYYNPNWITAVNNVFSELEARGL